MHNKVTRSKNLKTASIVGARGYSGLEIVRLLLNHPEVEIKYCFATEAFDLKKYFSSSKIENIKCFNQTEILNYKTDIVFLATPAEISLKLAPALIKNGSLVIDISGAFRLKNNSYSQWYGFEHDQLNLLASAHYGLHPWVKPAKQKMIANPGCYATAINMALIPLIKENLVQLNSIVVDAKSGTTGAGKKATENLIYSEVEGECLPYKIGTHQHYPEMVETIEKFTSQKIDFHFSTSLLPIRRGIIANIFAKVNSNITEKDIQNCFDKYYENYSMIRAGSLKEYPELVSLKKVVGTNKTHISYTIEKYNDQYSKLYVFSTIDNLLKGAAGQAVENMNTFFDYPIDLGLADLEALQ